MNIGSFASREPIRKGWSDDRKYRVTDARGTAYLLRISAEDRYERRKRGFELMKRVAALGVPMCEPIAFGRCDEGVYLLQAWIEGEDLESVIGAFSEAEQTACGLEAGRILKRIHSIPAPPDQEDWEPRFNRKMDGKIRKYGECPIHYENGQAFLDYIRANRHWLKGRPQVYQHGDYHIGNMMLDSGGRLRIIDFDREDFGDPWEEFNRIVWCAQRSPLFASGMVYGYFGGEPPLAFWRLLALYIASNALSSICWAVPFGQSEVDVMLAQGRDILEWYDGMRRMVPGWYAAPSLPAENDVRS